MKQLFAFFSISALVFGQTGTEVKANGPTISEQLFKQRDDVCRLFDDVNRDLDAYKKSRSHICAKLLDKDFRQISSKWDEMTDTYRKINDTSENKAEVLTRLRIDKDGAISKLKWYKAFIEGEFNYANDTKIARMAANQKKVPEAIRQEFADLFQRYKP